MTKDEKTPSLLLEILNDAFLTFRAPSSKTADAEPPPAPVAKLRGGDDKGTSSDMKGLVDTALKLQDQFEGTSAIATHRVTRLLVLNMAVAGLISVWMQRASVVFSASAADAGRVMVTVVILLAAKAVVHALLAIHTQKRTLVTPDLVSAGEKCAAGVDLRDDLLQKLHQIRACHVVNDRGRAMVAEHSILALHTTVVQLLLIVPLLVIAMWLPRPTARDEHHPVSAASSVPCSEQSRIAPKQNDLATPAKLFPPDGGSGL